MVLFVFKGSRKIHLRTLGGEGGGGFQTKLRGKYRPS